ncbi:MAG: ubiquinol-cytochrome C chaperone family protein [Hyphomicrobiaceae bacterium]
MLGWLRQRAELRHIGRQLYDRIVAQARSEPFYRDLCVPDTMEGRFEMITLHLYLVRERLKGEGAAGQRLGQLLLEHLIADMDDALRQIGYDMGVPKRVKKAAAAFGDRSRAYQAALAPDAAVGSLAAALIEGVYAAGTGATIEAGGACQDLPRQAAGLAAYMKTARSDLAQLTSDAIFAGQIAFPAVKQA